MKTEFTREEVIQILVSVFVFAGSNEGQDVNLIKGTTYGEMAETVIKANESIEGTNKSLISVLSQFKG